VLLMLFTDLHAAHQKLPPAIRTLPVKQTIRNMKQKGTKYYNMIRT